MCLMWKCIYENDWDRVREEVLNSCFKSLQIIHNIFYPASNYQTELPSDGSREGHHIFKQS